MAESENPLKSIGSCPARFVYFAKAGCTKDLIRMFCDALAAKKPAALWASRHRFPGSMKVTSLVCQI